MSMFNFRNLVVDYPALITGILLGASTQQSNADFTEAIQGKPPGQVEITANSFNADHSVDEKGNRKKVDVQRQFVRLTLKYKDDGLFASAGIPYSSIDNRTANESAGGFGDLELKAGPIGKVGNWFYLATLEATLPTGEYDSSRKANTGTGDVTVGSWLRTTRLWKYAVLDAAIGYTHKFEGDEAQKDTDTLSGKLTVGANIKTVYGTWQIGAETVARDELDTSHEISIGPAIRYIEKDGNWHLTGIARRTIDVKGAQGGWNFFIGFRYQLPGK